MARSPFDVLGISADAEPEVIAAAYRALAHKYHPDANPGVPTDELNERMAELNWAKEELDRDLASWRLRRSASAPSAQTEPSATQVMDEGRFAHDAFRPPSTRLDWVVVPPIPILGTYNRWVLEDLMAWKPWFILCLLMPPGWILHGYRLWHIQFGLKPIRRWIQELCDERGAIVMEQVTYLSGHPLLPMPEEGALFVRSSDLHLELRSGAVVDVPLASIGTPSFYSHERRGMYVTTELAGMFLTNEILHRTEYFVQFPFRDDKGYDNVMRFGCGNLVGPDILSNLIVSARYQNAPARA